MIEDIKKGHYVIVKGEERKKPVLVRVTSVRNENVSGVIEHKNGDEENTSFTVEDVLANLGQNPPIGRVYNADTERLIMSYSHDVWGTVKWFFKPDEDTQKTVDDALDEVAELLGKQGLFGFMPCNVALHWKPTVARLGKAGTYSFTGGEIEENPDTIKLFINPFLLEQIKYCLIHESGHGVWFRSVPAKGKLSWIKRFLEFAQEEAKYTEQDVRSTVFAVQKNSTLELEDETYSTILHDYLLPAVRDLGIEKREIDILVEHDVETLVSLLRRVAYWPIREHTFENDCTEYSQTNVAEYFAECFAAHLSGMKLSKETTALLTKTLSRATGK